MMDFYSKNHINILNLLSKCEKINDKSNWRLEQYIKATLLMLEDEEKKTGKLNDELIAAKKKAQFYQGLIDAQSRETFLEQVSAINSLSSNVATTNGANQVSQTKVIHLSEIAKCEKKMKEQLLKKRQQDNGFSSNNNNNIRPNHSNKNYDEIVKYHQLLQERVTNEMLELIQNLKQNNLKQNEIVKKDTELLDKTNRSTDVTVSNLKRNTDKIKEFANAACEYWLWITLFIVCLTFLSMVLFIRLFPKL